MLAIGILRRGSMETQAAEMPQPDDSSCRDGDRLPCEPVLRPSRDGADLAPAQRPQGSPTKEPSTVAAWGDATSVGASAYLRPLGHHAAGVEKGDVPAPVLQGVLRCAVVVRLAATTSDALLNLATISFLYCVCPWTYRSSLDSAE